MSGLASFSSTLFRLRVRLCGVAKMYRPCCLLYFSSPRFALSDFVWNWHFLIHGFTPFNWAFIRNETCRRGSCGPCRRIASRSYNAGVASTDLRATSNTGLSSKYTIGKSHGHKGERQERANMVRIANTRAGHCVILR
jgi:hypothetical protein